MRRVMKAAGVEVAVETPDLPDGVEVRVAVTIDATGVGADVTLDAVARMGGLGAFFPVHDFGGPYALLSARDAAGGLLSVVAKIATDRPAQMVESELVARIQNEQGVTP